MEFLMSGFSHSIDWPRKTDFYDHSCNQLNGGSCMQAFSPQTNYRKGGLLSLAAATVALADLNQVQHFWCTEHSDFTQ